MDLQNTNNTRFKLSRFLFPLDPPRVVKFPNISSSFSEPEISNIEIPTVKKPRCSVDFSFDQPKIKNYPFLSTTTYKENLVERIINLPDPFIESFFKPIEFNFLTGRNYSNDEEGESKATQLPLEAYQEICKHGSPKPVCSYCSEEEEKRSLNRTRKEGSKQVDIFDLLLPILNPPLGEHFNDPISVPNPLYNFQRKGVKFLVNHQRSLLADDMGTGKSIQTIIALRVLFRLGRISSAIIICPKSVLYDWDKKLWDWAPDLQANLVRGNKAKRKMLWKTKAHIHIVNYAIVREDIEILPKDGFDLAVLDEIQKIKNPSTQTTKAVRKIDADSRWGLSGTPVENNIDELISIFAYLKPGLLKYKYADNPNKVKRKIKPFFLRRRLEDVRDEIDLGDKVKNEVWLDLLPAQKKRYKMAEEKGVVKLNSLGEEVTIQHVLALITELKKICNRDPVTNKSVKAEYLIETVEDNIHPDDKVLVFSQYPHKTLEPIKGKLDRFGARLYSGSLSDTQRERMIQEFENNDDLRLLLMSVKAGGLGLTITRANHVIHFDHWWNPAVADQAEGRAYRIGQDKTVFVTTLFTRNTIEEKIHNIISRKRALFDEVVDDLSDTSLSSIISEEELFGLFDLETKKKNVGSKIGIEELDPYEFEELSAKLFRKMGYSVKITKKGADGGVDLYVKKDTPTGLEHAVVQCKHYPRRKVGVDKVRELFGVVSSMDNVSRAVLLTSGRFTSSAQQFSRGKDIKLINGDELNGIIRKHNIEITA